MKKNPAKKEFFASIHLGPFFGSPFPPYQKREGKKLYKQKKKKKNVTGF